MDVDAVFSWIKTLGHQEDAHPIWVLCEHSGAGYVALSIAKLGGGSSSSLGEKAGNEQACYDNYAECHDRYLDGSVGGVHGMCAPSSDVSYPTTAIKNCGTGTVVF